MWRKTRCSFTVVCTPPPHHHHHPPKNNITCVELWWPVPAGSSKVATYHDRLDDRFGPDKGNHGCHKHRLGTVHSVHTTHLQVFIGGGSLGLLDEWPESTVAIGCLLQTKSSKSPTESDANRSCAMPWFKLLTHIVSTMLVWGPIITNKQIAEPTFEPLCGSEHYLIPSTGQSGHFPYKRMARTGDT